MHALVEFLLARIAEDRAMLQRLDGQFGTQCVSDCDATRRIVEVIGLGLGDSDSLANHGVMLLLARPYDRHTDFQPDWRSAPG